MTGNVGAGMGAAFARLWAASTLSALAAAWPPSPRRSSSRRGRTTRSWSPGRPRWRGCRGCSSPCPAGCWWTGWTGAA
ncbi:hypothetical protein NKG94_13205 [Micromonospora sp. M12]